MEIFQKILVPVDGSLQSKIAQEMAVFISKLFESKVTLMHVVRNELVAFGGEAYIPRESFEPMTTGQIPREVNLPQTRRSIFPDEVINEVTEQYWDKGQTLLAEGVSMFAAAGVSATKKLVDGKDIAESIIAEVESGDYNLVIMGNSSGEEEADLDLHLGSVAKKVSLGAKTQVMVVRKKNDVKKLLVPVDGSAKENKALQVASQIAKTVGATSVLLHVQEKSLLKLRPEIKQIGLQIMQRASPGFEGTTVEQKLIAGDPAKMIIQTAEQTDVDLIVMTGGGHGAFRGLVGGVSDHVLHHATVPILLVK
jgi:nucleotide-binding universal stress UspA family protein